MEELSSGARVTAEEDVDIPMDGVGVMSVDVGEGITTGPGCDEGEVTAGRGV